MGLVDRFKNLVNPVDTDEDYEPDEYVFDNQDNNDYNAGYEEDYQQAQQQQMPPQNAPRRTPQNNIQPQPQSSVIDGGNALEVRMVSPERWEDVNTIADNLISHRTVVMNLEKANKELARRMIDFLFGVVYTINGDIKKVAPSTWVIAPPNVTLSQDQLQRGRNGSVNY